MSQPVGEFLLIAVADRVEGLLQSECVADRGDAGQQWVV